MVRRAYRARAGRTPASAHARGRVGSRIRGAGAQGARFFLRRAMRRCPNVGLASSPSIAQGSLRDLFACISPEMEPGKPVATDVSHDAGTTPGDGTVGR